MSCRGTVGERKEDGGRRGFSLTPTWVGSGRGSRHSSRRGSPSKYKKGMGGKVAKREQGGTCADTC